MALAQRLDRETSDAGIKEAVKALHQGLSCLAGQINATDSHSAYVAAQLTINWEQLARRLGDMRGDFENTRQELERRLMTAEKNAQYNVNALDHALEKIEAFAHQRAVDIVESQRQATKQDEILARLSDCFAMLEKRLNDADLAPQLKNIEQALKQIGEQQKQGIATEQLVASVKAFDQRMAALERDHDDLLAELRARVLQPAAAPLPEPPPVVGVSPPNEPLQTDPIYSAVPDEGFCEVPIFEEIFTQAGAEADNFLTRARLSARVADPKPWPWPSYLGPAAVAVVALLASLDGMSLSRSSKHIVQNTQPPAMRSFSVPEPPVRNDTQFMAAPQANDQGNAQSGDTNHNSMQRFQPETQDGPSRTALPLKQHQLLRHSPVNPPADVAKAAANSPDRVIELANAGNPTALTMAGLKALDGTGGSSVNLNDAVRLLTQAAEKGQAVAQYRLGTLYERGQGVAADPVKAAHWYELAANQGNRKAMHNLAVSYASGAAGKKNMAEAARWFAKAAALGLSDSQFNLAVLYERGDGVPQSLLDAYKWYSIAAQSGDPESKARIAVLQTQLSDPDKAAANKSAATFHAAPLNRSANVPPEMADLGG
jgi:localization factor PodJL